MTQWQVVQHKSENGFQYSLSLVDIDKEDNLKFIVSIASELVDGSFVGVFSGAEDKWFKIKPEDFMTALLQLSNENNAIIGYSNE